MATRLVEREDLQEAWEGWGRSALWITLGLVAVAIRYFGWVDDGPFAVTLIPSFWALAALFVVASAWARLKTRRRRQLALAVGVLSVGAALWVPWTVVGPNANAAVGFLESPSDRWNAPALSDPRSYQIEVTATPRKQRAPVQLRLGEGPGAKLYNGEVTVSQMSKRRAEKVGKDKSVLSWRLTDEVANSSFVVTVVESAKQPLVWPVSITIRQRPPGWPPFVLIAIILLVAGVLLDVRASRLRPTYVATLGASAGAFGPMFSTLYRADTPTRSSVFAIFLALLVGAVAAAVAVTIARKLSPPIITHAAKGPK